MSPSSVVLLFFFSCVGEGVVEVKVPKKRLIQTRSSRLQSHCSRPTTFPVVLEHTTRRDDPKRYRNSKLPKYGAGRREQRGPGGLVKGMQGVPLTRKPGRYDQAVPVRWPTIATCTESALTRNAAT